MFAGSTRRSRSMTPFLVSISAPEKMDACVNANSMVDLVWYRAMKPVYFGTLPSYAPFGFRRRGLAMPLSLLDWL